MNENKTKELANILKKLNDGENPETIKLEAREFLATISPADLSIAEQSLIDNGLETSALRHLCSAHMDMLKGNIESLKGQLPASHVIFTMINEHDIILKFLDELETINIEVQKEENYNNNIDKIKELGNLAKNLLGAEPHHQREEKVLFPALEAAGVSGPPRIMVMEHEEMRELKKRLQTLADIDTKLSFSDFKESLNRVVESLVYKLRDHIFKENNILYPTALSVINSEKEWANLKTECDLIGYCDFTPETDK